jgi:hypothetical protein
MARKFVSVEDYVNISNMMATYMWLVDSGDEEGWGDLFTEDAIFYGVPHETRYGREEIKKIAWFTGQMGGTYRHLSGNHSIEYGETTDEAYFRYYALMTTWVKAQGPQFDNMALAETHLVRVGDGWKIKTNTVKLLVDGVAP